MQAVQTLRDQTVTERDSRERARRASVTKTPSLERVDESAADTITDDEVLNILNGDKA